MGQSIINPLESSLPKNRPTPLAGWPKTASRAGQGASSDKREPRRSRNGHAHECRSDDFPAQHYKGGVAAVSASTSPLPSMRCHRPRHLGFRFSVAPLAVRASWLLSRAQLAHGRCDRGLRSIQPASCYPATLSRGSAGCAGGIAASRHRGIAAPTAPPSRTLTPRSKIYPQTERQRQCNVIGRCVPSWACSKTKPRRGNEAGWLWPEFQCPSGPVIHHDRGMVCH